MFKDGLILAFGIDTEKCKTCMLTKITKKPFQNVKRKTKVLELIHSDLCDLHATPSSGNKKYFMTFIDDASRFCYVYLLHSKDEAFGKFKVFKTEVELQRGSLIKRFRIDRRGLSQGFWGESMLTTCYLLNRVPNKRNKITPYELWTKRKPNLNYLRAWGCRAVVRLPDTKIKTLGERGIECIFVRYVEHSKAFRFYVIEPNESVLINSIIESRDAIFDENIFFLISRPSLRIPNGNEDIGGSVILEDVNAKADLTKEFLSSRFSMKDIGEADVILSIRIHHKMSTPIDTCEKLRPNNGQVMSQLEYSRVVGYLMYAMTCTRPDLAFAVGKVSRYTSNPSTQHCATTLEKAYSQMYNEKSRHLDVRQNMIYELIMNGMMASALYSLTRKLKDTIRE
nr:zinc finger, CCHC-type [Tanacetum cinerariifolium]